MGCVQPWRPLVGKFCILLWQASAGREIERYTVREQQEDMRKKQEGEGEEYS
jgi:hypothetical protein